MRLARKEIRAICRLRTRHRPDSLDILLEMQQSTTNHACLDLSNERIMYLSQLKIVSAMFAVAQLCIGIVYACNFSGYGTADYVAYKVISDLPVEFAANKSGPTKGTILMNLRWNGCRVYASVEEQKSYDTSEPFLHSQSVAFTKQIRSNGFDLSNPGSGMLLTTLQNATRIRLFGSSSVSGPWTLVGSAPYRAVPEGIRALDGRSNETLFDFRAPWPLVLFCIASSLISAIGFTGSLLISVTGPMHSGGISALKWLCVAHIVEGCVASMAAAGFLSIGLSPSAFSPANHALVCWGFATMGFRGKGLSFIAKGGGMVLLGLWRLVAEKVEDYMYADYGRTTPPPPLGILLLFLGMVYLFVCWRTARQTLLHMKRNYDCFEEMWAVHRTSALEAVAARCQAIIPEIPLPNSTNRRHGQETALWCDVAPSRRRAFDPAKHRLSRFSQLFGRMEGDGLLEHTVVCSLEQLYSQAFVVVQLLDDRCRLWCEHSGGALHYELAVPSCTRSVEAVLAPGGRFTALVGSTLESWVLSGCIKAPDRAVRKAHACYGGDASQLLDICRHRLFFERPEQIDACMQCICADPSVRVVRIRGGARVSYRIAPDSAFRVRFVAQCVAALTRFFPIEPHKASTLKESNELKHIKGVQ